MTEVMKRIRSDACIAIPRGKVCRACGYQSTVAVSEDGKCIDEKACLKRAEEWQ